MKRFTGILLAALFAGHTAFAGMEIQDSNSKLLGFAAKILCGSGLTCSIAGAKVSVQTSGIQPNGVTVPGTVGTTSYVAFIPYPVTTTSAGFGAGGNGGILTGGTASTVNLTSIYVPVNAKLTGVAINNGATCGTNKYVVALFNSTGVPVANSALAGVLCSGANAWQDIPFTSTTSITGPGIYFAGVYMNGTTDKFLTIPQAGEYAGLTGSVAVASFGVVSSVSVPTSFTSGFGPIVHTY